MRQSWSSALLLTTLFVLSTMPLPTVLDAPQPVHATGQADRVVFDAPALGTSSDEVVQFTALIYDAVNNPLDGQVNWSASNGTIDTSGLFYPWSTGQVQIVAEHQGLMAHHNITVQPGVAVAIDIPQRRYDVRLAQALQAELLDVRGNAFSVNEDVLWDVDGTDLGAGQPVWTPRDLGVHSLRARYNQLEVVVNATVTPGQPHSFEFPANMQVQAGTSLLLSPSLVDRFGYAMPLSTVPSITWNVENGTVNGQGEYFAARTGRWAVSATYQNITGTGELHVIPGEAVASALMLVNDEQSVVAGEAYELVFERRDINGYIGHVSPSIQDITVSSGGLSIDDNLRVYWNPSSMGTATVTGIDGDVTSSFTATVEHGRPIDVVFNMNPRSPHAGDDVTLTLEAVDAVGNRWVVPGNFSIENGEEDNVTIGVHQVHVDATSARSWRVAGRWFDNGTGLLYSTVKAFDVAPGGLAFIQLSGEGTQVPADGELDLNPVFFDAYSNELDPVALNWTLDGTDITLQMLLNDGRWLASSLGGHELRVNAAGVFATIRVTVVPGNAHLMVTSAPEGMTLTAGVPTDLSVSVVDIHGNSGEATAVTTDFNQSLVSVSASPTGLGYWEITGKVVGEYTMMLEENGATIAVPIRVVAGEPIRIQSSLSRSNIAEGETVLMEVLGVDAFGNEISIPFNGNTTVDCNAGPDTFVTNGTWKIDVDSGGTDRSCTIRWNGLLAQTFFDVEEVLLGGAVGSTNNAMALASVLLCFILGALVMLLRKASMVDEEAWVEEAFGDEEKSLPNVDQATVMEQDAPPLHERHGLTKDDVAALATEAQRVGVMQATPSTDQGSTGWYVDASEELQYWEVTAEGEWVRHHI